MITFLVFAAVGGLLWLWLKEGMLFALAASLGMFVAIWIGGKYKVEKKSTPLVCINDGSSSEGNFFLGSGCINGEMTYTYYLKIKDYYKLEQLPASDVLIKYTNGQAHIVKIKRYPDSSIKNWFGLHTTTIRFVIYVPKGSIKNNYQLDAK